MTTTTLMTGDMDVVEMGLGALATSGRVSKCKNIHVACLPCRCMRAHPHMCLAILGSYSYEILPDASLLSE